MTEDEKKVVEELMSFNPMDYQITAPDPHQIVIVRNPTYWKSLLVGLTAPFLNLPLMLWQLIVLPVWRGVLTIVRFTLTCWIFGPLGWLVGMPFMKPTFVIRRSDE